MPSGVIQNVEDHPNFVSVTIKLDGSAPNELLNARIEKSVMLFKRWDHLLTPGTRVGGISLDAENQIDLRGSFVHPLDIKTEHVSASAPSEQSYPARDRQTPISQGGPQLRAQIKKPPGVNGLWLQIENYGDLSRENAVWWHDRNMATRFRSIDEFKQALARHSLDPNEYRLLAPKETAAVVIEKQTLTNGTVAKARVSDPGTSHEAAESIRPTELEMVVLEGLRQCGDRGATSDELGAQLKMDRDSVSPRMKPLIKKGYVIDSGARRPGDSGRSQTVWKAIK